MRFKSGLWQMQHRTVLGVGVKRAQFVVVVLLSILHLRPCRALRWILWLRVAGEHVTRNYGAAALLYVPKSSLNFNGFCFTQPHTYW